MINATNVSKRYGNIKAVKELSLSVGEGKIFALLGPNGAGKTTFIKSLLSLTPIDKGQILIDGKDYQDQSSREILGYLPEKFSFFDYYTVKGVLEFYANMRGVSKADRNEAIQSAIKRLDIEELKDRKLKTLSKGQLQRVGIATLLIGDLKLLIMDEPFTGLDPIGLKDLKKIILSEKEKGKTIFINSHILSEIEQICEELAIIDKGAVLRHGNLKELRGDKSLEDFFYNVIKGTEDN